MSFNSIWNDPSQQGYAQVIFDDLKIGIDKNESEKVIFNGLQELEHTMKITSLSRGWR